MTGDSRKDVSVEVPSGNIKAEGGAVGPQLRHRNPNSAKFEIEEKTGNIWSEVLGRFVSYHRMIDRKNDLYYIRQGRKNKRLEKNKISRP